MLFASPHASLVVLRFSLNWSILYGLWLVYISPKITGAHKKNEDLGKVNPRRTIPAMDDNGFYLSERYKVCVICI